MYQHMWLLWILLVPWNIYTITISIVIGAMKYLCHHYIYKPNEWHRMYWSTIYKLYINLGMVNLLVPWNLYIISLISQMLTIPKFGDDGPSLHQTCVRHLTAEGSPMRGFRHRTSQPESLVAVGRATNGWLVPQRKKHAKNDMPNDP